MYRIIKLLIFLCLINNTALAADTAADVVKQGIKLWLGNNIPAAEEKFKYAIKNFPEEREAYARLAGLYLTDNRFDQAIAAYQNVINMDPENARLFAGISMAYLHLARYQMAQSMASEALRLDPELKQAKNIKKYIEAKLKKLDKENASLPKPKLPGITPAH